MRRCGLVRTIGKFETPLEAARAQDAYVVLHHLQSENKLNFAHEEAEDEDSDGDEAEVYAAVKANEEEKEKAKEKEKKKEMKFRQKGQEKPFTVKKKKKKGASKERALDAAVQSSADSAENVAGAAVAAPPASKKKRRKGGPSSSSSTYYGVSWNRTQQKWTSQVWNKLTKKQIRIGSFIGEADAARAVDAYIVKGGLARELNFPDDHKKKKKSKRKHPATAATIDAVSPTCRVDADAAATESKMYRPLPLPTPSPLSKKQRKAEANGTSSRFLGVTRAHQRWIAQLRVNGATKYLGSFRDELDAARAVDACIVENSLRKALNFPAADTNTQTAAAASRAQTTEDAAGIALAAPPALTKKKRKRRRGMCGRAGPFVHTSRTVPSFMLAFISPSRFLFSMIHYPSMREYRTAGERRVASHNNSSWERKGEGVILRETVRMRAYVRALRSAAACGVVSPARLSSPWSLVESLARGMSQRRESMVCLSSKCLLAATQNEDWAWSEVV